jgi:hypothetical protein
MRQDSFHSSMDKKPSYNKMVLARANGEKFLAFYKKGCPSYWEDYSGNKIEEPVSWMYPHRRAEDLPFKIRGHE